MIARARADVVYRVAFSLQDRAAAFGLVHQAYVDSGLDAPNPYAMRVIAHHLLPTTEVFVAEATSIRAVIATVSLVADGAMGLPMESIYAEEVDRFRNAGRRVAEVSCLAESHDHVECGFAVVVRIMGLMAQCAKYRGIHDLLIAVHPHHAKFYNRYIAFHEIGEQKLYDKVQNNPAVAMALDLSRLHLDHPRVYQRFFGDAFPETMLRPSVVQAWSPDYLRQIAELRAVYRNQDVRSPSEAPRWSPSLVPLGAAEKQVA